MMLSVLFDDGIRRMSMEEYLLGAVAGTMAATNEREALKAQAVIARTNALYNVQVRARAGHPQADVCTDFECCTAFFDDDRLLMLWGNDYLIFMMKIISAVTETDGIYISYYNRPILAVYHSVSAGQTESAGQVWPTDFLPYLRSVPSPETLEEIGSDFITTYKVDGTDFTEIVLATYTEAVFDENPEHWITDIVHTDSGRIGELSVGGVVIAGTALRELFDLRSTFLNIEFADGYVIFTATGFGHGVGMSQAGANIMAARGYTFNEILLAYFTGVELARFTPD
jgi:stage II sporulation protein D